jgi:hypothetical protein
MKIEIARKTASFGKRQIQKKLITQPVQETVVYTSTLSTGKYSSTTA